MAEDIVGFARGITFFSPEQLRIYIHRVKRSLSAMSVSVKNIGSRGSTKKKCQKKFISLCKDTYHAAT